MVIYVRGKKGGLSNALEGLERGLGNGLQLGMQQRRLDQQDAQYQDAKARAERELAIEEAQNARAQQDQDYQTKQRAEIDAGQKEISQYALDYQGKDEAVGQGLGAFADLQQAQNAKAERASRIVKKLPAVLQDRFRSEFRAEMEDEQNIALMEHLKTRLTNAGASPLRSEGGELGHKGEERAAQLQSWQEAVDLATTPEARAQLVPQIANGLRALQIDDAIELKRLRTVARVADTAKQAIAQKAQLIDQARAIGEPPEVIADMEASLEAMETTAAMYEASGGEMTATQLNSAMQVARGARAPRSGARTGTGTGSQDGARGAWNQKDLYEAAVKSLQPDYMETGAAGEQIPKSIPPEVVRTRMREIENGVETTPDILPMGSVPSTTSQTAETPAIDVPQDVQMGAQEMYAKARETMSVEEAKKAIEVWIRSQVTPIKDTVDGIDAGGSLIRQRNKQPANKPKKKEPVRTGSGEDYMRDPRIRAALATKPKPRE